MDKKVTKYPVVLVHGFQYKDFFPLKTYWGKIPDYLRSHGVEVYVANQDAYGTIENNAKQLKSFVEEILEKHGYEKVNLIGHSKGGLDSRYMISLLDMDTYVASLTTVSTPHRGSAWADYLFEKFKDTPVEKAVFSSFWLFSQLAADRNPQPDKASFELTSWEMEKFNKKVKDRRRVYYQSYGSVMKSCFPGFLLNLSYKVIKKRRGPNDGLVSEYSFKWAEYRGLAGADTRCGVSHFEIIKFTDFTGFNAKEFFLSIVEDLAGNGF